jgi:hypothetical protein
VLAQRLVERCQDPAGQVLRVGAAPGEQHGELVTAHPDRHTAARLVPQHGRHRPQQAVADVVAEQIVDGLEVVEIDEQHGCRLARGQGGGEPVVEQGPVGQPGQAVVGRLVLQAGLLDVHRPQQPGVVPEHEVLPDRDQRGHHHGGDHRTAAGPAHRVVERHRDQRDVDRGHRQVGKQRVAARAVLVPAAVRAPLRQDAHRGQDRRHRHDHRLGRHGAGVAETDRHDRVGSGGEAAAQRDEADRGGVDRAGSEVGHLRDGRDGEQEREPDQNHRLRAPRLGCREHRGQAEVPQHGHAAEERDGAIERDAPPLDAVGRADGHPGQGPQGDPETDRHTRRGR